MINLFRSAPLVGLLFLCLQAKAQVDSLIITGGSVSNGTVTYYLENEGSLAKHIHFIIVQDEIITLVNGDTIIGPNVTLTFEANIDTTAEQVFKMEVDPYVENRSSLALASTDWKLFPNPTTYGKVNIQCLECQNKEVEVILMNTMGQFLDQHTVRMSGVYTFKLPALSAGLYWLILKEGGKIIGKEQLFVK